MKSELGTYNSRKKFEVTTNKGADLDVTVDQVSLKGTSPYGVIHVEVEGHPEARPIWTGLTGWEISGIQLHEGEQLLKILGTDQWGNVRNDTQIKVKKSGNSSPLADLKARPSSWNLSVDDSLDMDARDSYDPEGQSLKFDWMATNLDELDLKIFDRARAKAFFKRPGLYEFTVKITDEDGKFSNVNREAAVHGVNGFSGFGAPILKDYWVTENVGPRGNFSLSSLYSVDDVPGWLEIQAFDM